MAMPRLIAPAKRLLEQGLKFGPFPFQCFQAFESNIDFEIRCVHLFQLRSRDPGDLLALKKLMQSHTVVDVTHSEGVLHFQVHGGH